MTDKTAISVIMPVYGVEDYVGRAIESIVKQSFGDFEFLIVDDGSKDGSGAICDRYAAQDDRITVFHKENGGAPSARNYAMDRAKGEYYYFMDGDDWVESNMLERLYQLAKEHDAQMVVAAYYIDTYYDGEHYYREEKSQPPAVYGDAKAFRTDAHKLFDNNLLYTPWNKLFLRSFVEEQNIRFRPTFMDDFPFNLDVVRDIERVVVTDEKFYHFIRARAESETSKYRANMYEKREEEDGWMQELYQYWGIDHEEIQEFLARRYIERLVGCVENITSPNSPLNKAEKIAVISQIIKTPRAQESCRAAQPRSRYMSLLIAPIRSRNADLMYRMGSLISWVKKRNVKLFAMLKAKR